MVSCTLLPACCRLSVLSDHLWWARHAPPYPVMRGLSQGLFLEDGDSRIRLRLSPILGLRAQSEGLLSPVLSVWRRQQHPGAQAHDGSIGQPLEQESKEEPGLVRATGNPFML